MRTLGHCVAAAVLVVVAALPSGCKDSSTAPTGPAVANSTDNFAYSTPRYDGHTGTESYAWHNTGTSADVIQASSLTNGFATLTISDAAAVQVYQATLSAAGTFQTAIGSAGTWNIRVDYAHAIGSVSFTVKKY